MDIEIGDKSFVRDRSTLLIEHMPDSHLIKLDPQVDDIHVWQPCFIFYPMLYHYKMARTNVMDDSAMDWFYPDRALVYTYMSGYSDQFTSLAHQFYKGEFLRVVPLPKVVSANYFWNNLMFLSEEENAPVTDLLDNLKSPLALLELMLDAVEKDRADFGFLGGVPKREQYVSQAGAQLVFNGTEDTTDERLANTMVQMKGLGYEVEDEFLSIPLSIDLHTTVTSLKQGRGSGSMISRSKNKVETSLPANRKKRGPAKKISIPEQEGHSLAG